MSDKQQAERLAMKNALASMVGQWIHQGYESRAVNAVLAEILHERLSDKGTEIPYGVHLEVLSPRPVVPAPTVSATPFTDSVMDLLIKEYLTEAEQNQWRERAVKCIAEQLGVNAVEVKDERDIIQDLGGDSLDEVELLMALEDEFKLEVQDDEAEGRTKVADIIRGMMFLEASRRQDTAAAKAVDTTAAPIPEGDK